MNLDERKHISTLNRKRGPCSEYSEFEMSTGQAEIWSSKQVVMGLELRIKDV